MRVPWKHEVEGRVKSFWGKVPEEEEGGADAQGRGQRNLACCEGVAWDFCSLVEKGKGPHKGEPQL